MQNDTPTSFYIYQTTVHVIRPYYHEIFMFAVLERWLIYD